MTPKRSLYLFIGFFCCGMLYLTLSQEPKNQPTAVFYWEEPSKEIILHEDARVQYGKGENGATEIAVKYRGNEISTHVFLAQEEPKCHSVFPVGNNYLGVAFKMANQLDTLLLFEGAQCAVFEHVLALDSDTGRIALLKENEANHVCLSIHTFQNKELFSWPLPDETLRLSALPIICTAQFDKTGFLLETTENSYHFQLSSLI